LPRKSFLAAVIFLFSALTPSISQSIQPLEHQPPDGAGIGFLLTDGTVLYQGNGESDWYKLTPDNSGSYVNGTWARMANLPGGYVPDAFASAVLSDGRVVITGGEYLNNVFTLTNRGGDLRSGCEQMVQPASAARLAIHWGFPVRRSAQRNVHGRK